MVKTQEQNAIKYGKSLFLYFCVFAIYVFLFIYFFFKNHARVEEPIMSQGHYVYVHLNNLN